VDVAAVGKVGLAELDAVVAHLADAWRVPIVRAAQLRPGIVRIRALLADPLTHPRTVDRHQPARRRPRLLGGRGRRRRAAGPHPLGRGVRHTPRPDHMLKSRKIELLHAYRWQAIPLSPCHEERVTSMDEDAIKAWLSEEVSDLLDVGPVGLYELKWMLNGSNFSLLEAEKFQLSRAVIESLCAAGGVEIVTLTWPAVDVISGPHGVSILDEDVGWLDDPSPQYLALQRIPSSTD
jgi:hypothetical protein